jgi:hypothetical protein
MGWTGMIGITGDSVYWAEIVLVADVTMVSVPVGSEVEDTAADIWAAVEAARTSHKRGTLENASMMACYFKLPIQIVSDQLAKTFH